MSRPTKLNLLMVTIALAICILLGWLFPTPMWGQTTQPAALMGTPIGTAGSYQNSGNTIARAFDGNLATYFDAPGANGDTVGLDTGSLHTITAIRFAPRVNWAGRMTGGIFQGSVDAAFTSPLTLATITAPPPYGVLATLPVTNTTPVRYVREVCPPGSFGNVAEIQVLGYSPAPPQNPQTHSPPAWMSAPTSPHATYYVDSVAGNVSNVGTLASPISALPSLSKKLVDGDAVFIKRGTTLTQGFGGWLSQNHLYIGAYGTGPRPIIRLSAGSELTKITGNGCLIVDLDVRGVGASKGLEVSGNDFRCEGCSFTGFFQGLNLSGGNGLTFVGCNFSHCYIAGYNPCGVYADFVQNLSFDSCVVDYNGWDGKTRTTSNQYSHGLYLSDGDHKNLYPIKLTNCIVAENAAWGAECRAGGVADNNFFVDNGIDGGAIFVGGASGEIKNNVLTGAKDAPIPTVGRGYGLQLQSLNGSMHDNFAAHSQRVTAQVLGIGATTSNQLPMNTGLVDVLNNRVVDWQGDGFGIFTTRKTINFTGNQIDAAGLAVYYFAPPSIFNAKNNAYRPGTLCYTGDKGKIPQPVFAAKVGETGGAIAPTQCSATIEGYAKSVGLSPSGQAFLAAAEANCDRQKFDPRLTAAAVNDYFRAAMPATQPSH